MFFPKRVLLYNLWISNDEMAFIFVNSALESKYI